jgi:hypothetical protein
MNIINEFYLRLDELHLIDKNNAEINQLQAFLNNVLNVNIKKVAV